MRRTRHPTKANFNGGGTGVEVDATIAKERLRNGALGSNADERPPPVGPSGSAASPYQRRSVACLERREFAHDAYGAVAPSPTHFTAQEG